MYSFNQAGVSLRKVFVCVDGVGCLLSSRIIFFSKGKIVVCFSIEMSMRSHIMEHTLIFFFSFFSNMNEGRKRVLFVVKRFNNESHNWRFFR